MRTLGEWPSVPRDDLEGIGVITNAPTPQGWEITTSKTESESQGLIGPAQPGARRTEEAHRVLDDFQAPPIPAATVLSEAWLLAALRDCDEAVSILDRLAGEKNLVVALTRLPGSDALRSEPRFPAFVERLDRPAV